MNDIYKESKNEFEITYEAIKKSKEFKLFIAIIIASLFGLWISLYTLIIRQIEISIITFVVSASFLSSALMTLHSMILSKLIVIDLKIRMIEKDIKQEVSKE